MDTAHQCNMIYHTHTD